MNIEGLNYEIIVVDFLCNDDRIEFATLLNRLQSLDDIDYHIINFNYELIDFCNEYNHNNPIVLQIIAHSVNNGLGFCVDNNNYIQYEQFLTILQRINNLCENRLIVNMMTICYSSIVPNQLFNGNQPQFNKLIGCLKDIGIGTSIFDSVSLYRYPRIVNLSYLLGNSFIVADDDTDSYVQKYAVIPDSIN